MIFLRTTFKRHFKQAAGRPWVELVNQVIKRYHDPRPTRYLGALLGTSSTCGKFWQTEHFPLVCLFQISFESFKDEFLKIRVFGQFGVDNPTQNR